MYSDLEALSNELLTEMEMLAGLQRSKMQNLEQWMVAVGELPAQVAAWRQQADEGGLLAQHQSQIDALQGFLTRLQRILKERWEDVLAAYQISLETPENLTTFREKATFVEFLVRRVYAAWRFYKERFDQRLGVDEFHKRFLDVADEVAWSAYRVCIDQAEVLGTITDRQRFKQPPLLHFQDSASPVIYARSRRALIPNVPVHVIDMPYYEASTAWSLLAIHHEVAHGLVQDLGLDAGTAVLLQGDEVGLASARRARWRLWAEEILADCMAVLLAGPPFVRELMDVLFGVDPGHPERGDAPHPPPFLRIPMACTFLRTLEADRPRLAGRLADDQADRIYGDLAERYTEMWQALHAQVDVAPFQPYLAEMDQMLTLLMDTPLMGIQPHTLRQLGSFTPGDWRLVRRVAEDYLAEGETSGEAIKPRLTISAARIAFDQLQARGAGPDQLETLHEHTLETVETYAEKGTRALMPGEEDFLQDLAEAFASQPPALTEWE